MRFLEFLIVGVAMGVVEDIIAIKLTTGAVINEHVVWIALLVAVPFAAFSELIVDWKHIKFLRKMWEANDLNRTARKGAGHRAGPQRELRRKKGGNKKK